MTWRRRDFLVTFGVAGGLAAGGVNALAQGTASSGGTAADPSRETGRGNGDPLAQAVQALASALTESADFIRHHPFYTDDLNRAAGMTFLSRMLLWSLQYKLNQDPDYPFFRVLDFNTRVGGDNPDQRYLMCPIRGGETYRIWGTKGSLRRLDLQVYAGTPWRKGAGRSASALATEDIQFKADGSFEITLSPERTPGNWLENPPDSTEVLIRQIISDWRNELPGEVHIDRIGYEGALKPALTSAEVARRINAVAEELKSQTHAWPDQFLTRTAQTIPANTLPPAADLSARGGMAGRYMSLGHFELADDEALVVTMWPSPANYQGIQLMDDWMSSLEYANRQTSLTREQAYLSKDGAYHFVVAHRDPGVSNWLDTMGLRHGGIIIRYDGMREQTIPPNRMPVAKKITLARLRRVLPKDTPAVTPAQREATIKERRRHVQRRFGV